MDPVPLAPNAHAPTLARRIARAYLGDEADRDLVATAVLVTSEMVTHAVLDRAAQEGGVLLFRLSRHGDTVRIELTDDVGRLRLASLSMGVAGGQGMRILAVLSSRWGLMDHGTTMWSEVEGAPAAAL